MRPVRPSQSRPDRAAAIYTLLSVAVVTLADKHVAHAWELALTVGVYTVALWLAHAYAVVVASARDESWPEALRSERPVLLGGFPATAGATIAAVSGATTLTAARIGVVLSFVALLAIQVWILRDADHSHHRIAATVVVDLVSAGVVMWLLLAVK